MLMLENVYIHYIWLFEFEFDPESGSGSGSRWLTFNIGVVY